MSRHHFVRVGSMGHVGRFTAVDAVQYRHGNRVILRTSRGLELGEVLGPAQDTVEHGVSDGSILRGMTVEDQLLEARLQTKRWDALQACEQLLAQQHSTAVLMDVEHLFDGQGLYFYFLGELPSNILDLTEQLAATYAMTTKFEQFSQVLDQGCGPGCGTESATGHGCTSCATGCSIAGACGVKK